MENQLIKLETRKRVSDLFLGHPHKLVSRKNVDGVRLVGRRPPSCHLDTPWVSVSRVVQATATGLRVTDTHVLRTALLSIDDLKSKRFAEFQKGLQKCFDRVAIVYRPLGVARRLSSTSTRSLER
jgi:hypothetical protein